MQKIIGFVIVLVIGLGVGFFVGTMYQTPMNPQSGTEGNVTIKEISCSFTNHADAELEIVIEDVRARTENLRGEVIVYQDGKQWTGEVYWHYTGYGFAQINCDTLSEDSGFRIKYVDRDSGVANLDRIIEWTEVAVSHTFTFIVTEQLDVQGATFQGTSGDVANTIVLTVQNTGTADLTVDKYKIGVGGTAHDIPDVAVAQGSTASVTLTMGADGQPWVSGTTYDIYVITSTGKQFPYRATAP